MRMQWACNLFKNRLIPAIVAAIALSGQCGIRPCLAAEDPVVAMVDSTPVSRSQLEQAASEYKKTAGKKDLTPNDLKEILKGIIRRNLILKHKDIPALRQSPEIARQVKEYENQLVIGRFLQDRVGQRLFISDAEMKAYYQSNINQFGSPPKVKASHILLRTRAEAETVLKKLKSGGNFAALAKQYSIDLPMALEGGSMGVIERGRSLPDIEKALFLLKEGEVSDIVETRFGFHILTVNEIIGQKYRPFDEVREDIRKILLKQKEAKAFDQMASELEKSASITIYEDRILGSSSP